MRISWYSSVEMAMEQFKHRQWILPTRFLTVSEAGSLSLSLWPMTGLESETYVQTQCEGASL